MDNGMKALLMAASVLFALMVISLLMYLYNNIVDLERLKDQGEEITQLTAYDKRFQQFNSTIYGSELLSLANLQEDYAATIASNGGEDLTGYKNLDVDIEFTSDYKVDGVGTFTKGEKELSKLLEFSSSIASKIKVYENTYYGSTGKTIKQLSGMSYIEIALLINVTFNSNDATWLIVDAIEKKDSNILDEISDYTNTVSSLTELKSKKFKCVTVEYNQYNGRIEYMLFIEQ